MSSDDAAEDAAVVGHDPMEDDGAHLSRADRPGLPRRSKRRTATDAEARALASSLRLRILRLTLDEALTNKEIAEALDRNPASVLHHVRTLVENGFLRAEPERRGPRGAREIPYRSTRKSWYIDAPGIMAGSIVEAFVSEISTVPVEQRDFSRFRINGSDVEDFKKAMYQLIREFHARPRDTETPPHSVFIAMHPDTSVPRRRPESPGQDVSDG